MKWLRRLFWQPEQDERLTAVEAAVREITGEVHEIKGAIDRILEDSKR